MIEQATGESRRFSLRHRLALAALLALAPAPAPADEPPRVPSDLIVACASEPGERQHCPADTSKGVVLAKSSGEAPCLLGKSWGYDDTGVWVSEGCQGEFVVGPASVAAGETATEKKSPAYVPNFGFLLHEGDKGEIYMRLFTYVRYLNQKGLDPSYTDYFGDSHTVKQRQDVQLNKFFLPFSGWFLTPKFRYYLYVWSSNPSQGEPAQVVGGGNISYTFNNHFTLGGGIAALPTSRSTEGQFPYWLGMDDRLTADEFFRGSYTMGIWIRGKLPSSLSYAVMLGNNLSNLGISAAQLSTGLNTQSFQLAWTPTTGEFGYLGSFGDYEQHQNIATRLGVHYTHSTEDKQSQPGSNGIENTQIRLTDGSVIFTPDLFGPGVTVDKVKYQMVSVDGGIKYKGLALEAEYYWRWLSDFRGTNTAGMADIDDHGFQVQSSAMAVPKRIQVYLSGSAIRGRYGNASEVRAGASWFIARERELRLNPEWIYLNKCPVGYTAVPYPVGGNGNIFHVNFEMSF